MSNSTVILVVDDEDGIRHYLKTLLQLKGYQVVPVPSGADALEFSKEILLPRWSCSIF
jgi:CheY-like chemotaxis protein